MYIVLEKYSIWKEQYLFDFKLPFASQRGFRCSIDKVLFVLSKLLETTEEIEFYNVTKCNCSR